MWRSLSITNFQIHIGARKVKWWKMLLNPNATWRLDHVEITTHSILRIKKALGCLNVMAVIASLAKLKESSWPAECLLVLVESAKRCGIHHSRPMAEVCACHLDHWLWLVRAWNSLCLLAQSRYFLAFLLFILLTLKRDYWLLPFLTANHPSVSRRRAFLHQVWFI